MENETIPLKINKSLSPELLRTVINNYVRRGNSNTIQTLKIDPNSNEIIGVDLNKGLTRQKYNEMKAQYGNNQYSPQTYKGFYQKFVELSKDQVLGLIFFSGIIALILKMVILEDRDKSFIDGVAIMVAVIINVLIISLSSFFKDYRAASAKQIFERKKKYVVLEENQLVQRIVVDLVVGDIVDLYQGMEIPADGILIESHSIITDESSLIKQKMYCPKVDYTQEGQGNNCSCVVLGGSHVVSGEGKMIILVVGEDSIQNSQKQIFVSEKEDLTPLQKQLKLLTLKISKFSLGSSLVIFFVILLRYLLERVARGNTSSYDWIFVVDTITFLVSLLFVSIPDGLCLAVSIAISNSVAELLKRGVYVHNEEAIEKLAVVDVLCCDKTGTFLENNNSVVKFWDCEEIKDTETNYAFENREGAACNTNANLSPQRGSKLELSLLKLLKNMNVDYQEYRNKYTKSNFERLSFTPQRRLMTTFIQHEQKVRVLTKGYPEKLIESCQQMYSWRNDQQYNITENEKNRILDVLKQYDQQNLRAIAIAYKDIDSNQINTNNLYTVENDNYVLLGILGIKDTVKISEKKAVQKLKELGVNIKLLTGDDKDTALILGQQVGLLDQTDDQTSIIESDKFISITGAVKENNGLYKINKQKQMVILTSYLKVLGRADPEIKQAFINGLQKAGYIVAVCAEGGNDRLSIQAADVGIAMGLSEDEITSDSSDIVLLQNSLEQVVQSVIWGKNIYQSIQSFIQFQLTANFVVIISCFILGIVIKEYVLTAPQMIWLNLIIDTTASIALTVNVPSEDLLKTKPYFKKQSIINRKMIKHVIGQTFYQVAVILLLALAGEQILPEDGDFLDDVNFGEVRFNPLQANFVRSGRTWMIERYEGDYQPLKEVNRQNYNLNKPKLKAYGPSRHYTIVFTSIIFMQIAHFFIVRQQNDEKFIFRGLTRSPAFIVGVIFVIISQVIIVEFSGKVLNCHYDGLNVGQWFICVGFGLLCWVVYFILTFINEDSFYYRLRSRRDKAKDLILLSLLKSTKNPK